MIRKKRWKFLQYNKKYSNKNSVVSEIKNKRIEM